MKKRKLILALMAVMVLSVCPVYRNMQDNFSIVWAATTIPGTWIQASDGRWWYKHTDGTYTKNNWEYINGKWYFFDESGWMVTGWKKIGDKWYYLNPTKTSQYVEGEMLTGWQKINGRWYYLNPTANGIYVEGEMLKDWQNISGKWYYLNPTKNAKFEEGERVTGWITLGDNTYYLDSNGVMKTGELIMDGKKYIFAESGELISEEEIIQPTNGDGIASAALNHIDTPFKWDGKNLSTGCNNAGFVYCIMEECGYKVSDNVKGQQTAGKAVNQDQLKAGDIVIFMAESRMAGIYLGENKVIYASGPRWGIRITTLQHPGKTVAFRRVWE